MTYCVALKLNDGLVLLSDTRTNAGLDNIATYRKMFFFEEPGERVIGILTAGSLSVTQTTIARLQEAVDSPDSDGTTSIMKAETMLGVADIIGDVLSRTRREIAAHSELQQGQATASMIVAGQRAGGDMRLFLVYPEGNHIEATDDTPYLQIGEHKYGKPILDRVVTPETSLEDAQKAALLSMDSTMKSNLSVGMPLDLAVIETDACRVSTKRRIMKDDPQFSEMSHAWSEALRDAFVKMPI
ncbi:MAG TPA: proteasome-type protease [Paracoccus sp. (in: a-proteobacteria)]|uniref:proteasome-type protease n=1 Tax=uncultured Paracoccus sp. TaxID=189685 RepID=UPI002639CDC1|nr:proteasome-type protease [uncultured Paracoccus sp.]HMQ41396.1 proteasome-type protease [Paracoccus sp. (in: a-proteobacteria)]HMR37102.1 proteasome-type protease [Paracoccus sp. (in: a-proteobacteria)]